MIKHLIFIVNPFSGTSSKNGIETIIANEMDRTKYSFDIFFTEYPSHASEIVRDHKSSDNVYGFVAVGGDGTVNEVASEIIGTDKVLGVIPQGSGNGFGCAIGMSRDLVKSIRILNQSTVQSIDTGLCNDNNFVNICGIGIDGQIVYKTKSDPSRGFFKYLKTTILLSFSYKPVMANIYIDSILKYSGKYTAIVVANGTTYGYDFKIAPLADYTDGVLDVVLIKDEPIYKYFVHLPKYFTKGVRDLSFVINDKAKKIEVEIDSDSYYHLDGEGLKHNGNYHFGIQKSSLKILIPKKI